MKNSMTFSLIGILVGIVAGYFIFSVSSVENRESMQKTNDMGSMMDQKMNDSMQGEGMMMHPLLEVDKTQPVPTIKVEALKDEKDGYNIRIVTSNYKWAPEHVNQDSVQGEGHGHIYVNDVKLARVYGEWFHIGNDKLKDGENVIKVTLNANEHNEWAVDGKHIVSSVKVSK